MNLITREETAYLVMGASGIVLVGLLDNIAVWYPQYSFQSGLFAGLVISIFIYIGLQSVINAIKVIQQLVGELAAEIVTDIYKRQYDSKDRR